MTDYPRPSYTVDAVVLCGEGDDTRLLVIRRGKDPYKGHAALPGGFTDPHEAPLSAVVRELAEETGLELPIQHAVQLSPRARKGRDPRGWTITQPWLFHLPEARPVKGDDDASAAWWAPLTELEELAFDHGAILCEALGKFWPQMPGHDIRLASIKPFGMPLQNTSAIFFGGSFNPWHEGHTACVQLCTRPEELVVVPDANPFKDGPENICYWKRYRQIHCLLKDHPGSVFPGFCGQETPNPTVGWLPYTHYQQKTLLIGQDNLTSLPRWRQAAQLVAALDEIQVAPRRESVKDLQTAITWLNQTNPSCEVTELEDHKHRDQSSTSIREGR